MCKGSNLFLQLILSLDLFELYFDCADYLYLKVADIAMCLSLDRQTASI